MQIARNQKCGSGRHHRPEHAGDGARREIAETLDRRQHPKRPAAHVLRRERGNGRMLSRLGEPDTHPGNGKQEGEHDDARACQREAGVREEKARRTLLRSTGLTFGTITTLYGLQAGIIDRTQFSLLMTVIVLSAIVPTAIGQRFLQPDPDHDATVPDERSAARAHRGSARPNQPLEGEA
jgi:hypothetical protein